AFATSTASASDPIAAKKAEAARIEAAIEAGNQRIDMLDEQFNQTSLRIQQANQDLADAAQRTAEAQRAAAATQRAVVGRAAILYTQAGLNTPFSDFDVSSVQELGARSHYAENAAQRDVAVLARLANARDLLHIREAELRKARAAAESQAASLASQRKA